MAQENSFGLTSEEARAALLRFGPNEVTSGQLSTFFSEVKKIFLDPMGLMLLVLGGLYWVLGDKTDSVILFCAFIPVTAVDVILEIRSGRVLRALKATLTPVAKVYRDGLIKDLPIRAIVPGDVLIFEEGQTLPADGKVIQAEHLNINEAALTGESVPISKNLKQKFFGGTTVLSGHGLGLVEKTGRYSKYGEIAGMLQEIREVKSPLRKKVDSLVKMVVGIAIFISIILFVVEWQRTDELIASLIVALTLGMAAIPEEFPLVFTLYLSLGAWRLSKMGLLVKSLPSVETLGGVDVICTDKTGTLTEGNFQLEGIELTDKAISMKDAWRAAIMACEVHAVDAMEIAIVQEAEGFKETTNGWKLIYDYPFEPAGKHMSHVWKNDSFGEMIIAMKGAVEGVLEHCFVNPAERKEVELTNAKFAGEGKRVLGLAYRKGSCTGNRLNDERELTFAGFLIFSDPIRSTVKEAIQFCQAEGIEVKMLTGDHLMTAHAVADQIGLTHTHNRLFTGEMLARLSDSELKSAFIEGSIFARVLPEQKYEMVKALQAQNKVVAMTGDGVNDAPALKLADIGISMGKSATDVARSSAKMVLLKNDFSGLVNAVFEGRKIFANLRRSFSYLISFHIPIILLAMVPPFLGWPQLLEPVHIILLELIVHPISAFTFENIKDAHLRKNTKGSLLSRKQFIRAALPGLIVSVGALWLFGRNLPASVETARSIAFSTVLFGNAFFVLGEVVPRFNFRFWVTELLVLAITFVAALNPAVEKFLHVNVLDINQLWFPFSVGALALAARLLVRAGVPLPLRGNGIKTG